MKFLKFAFLLGIFGVIFTSCLGDNRGDNVIYGYLATSKVEDKEIKAVGELSKLTVTYKTTNTCQAFVQFQITKNVDNVIELGVVGSQRSGDGCTDKAEEKTSEFSFTPPKAGTYTLKFWSGKNSDNSDQFIEHKVEIKDLQPKS
ncbi:hypothetical protein BAZ12_07700 [Elizabethkingia miricola]|jgi:hypothetical protein|uniref:Lipoprotein n=2 Tax=Elizabethkingia TaxID=308865 RepID=A0AAJ3NE23_9FLAO|nr:MULTISPECIES: hypothetical protein [Elizabethkingia]MDR2227905.1 hypothetical protein [Flavobacteriaceae bacterium]AQX08866.1 hypothetical protein BBD34_09515 [Elizabethkingia ursingii]KUY15825.1 hypothetical protein ATB95_17230 [Elizabethkingia miricola]MCL1652243.1 hypothetical protein [Elizabethkingia miricola]MCL1679787.1 hypothetical protein [Elizabethkingia miricola]